MKSEQLKQLEKEAFKVKYTPEGRAIARSPVENMLYELSQLTEISDGLSEREKIRRFCEIVDRTLKPN